MEGQTQHVFIDNGYDTIKSASFSTNLNHEFDYFELPTFMLPHLRQLGYFQFNKGRFEQQMQQYFSKELIINSNPILNAQTPIQHGRIWDIDQFEYAWQKIIKEFSSPMDQLNNLHEEDSHNQVSLIMTEPSVGLSERYDQREQITETAFESLNTSTFALVPAAPLKLFSTLKYSGVVVDFGADLTQITPVEDGYASFFSSSSYRVSGRLVDMYLLSLLQSQNKAEIPINTLNLEMIKRDLKEKQWDLPTYQLPDGTVINLGGTGQIDNDSLAFLYFNSDIVKEMQDNYFKPKSKRGSTADLLTGAKLQTLQANGLSNATPGDRSFERKSLVFKILKALFNYSSEENVDKNSIETILLTGGGLKLGNLSTIVQQQLEMQCIDEFARISIVQGKEPKSQVLQGARIYCAMKHLDSVLISKSEYQEEGPRIVNRKCY